MRRNWKVWLILALTVIAGYYLYPTLRFYSLNAAERDALRQNAGAEHAELQKNSINLGLDLQGGIHLVLEVDLTKLPPDEARDAVDRAQEVIRNRIDQFGVAEPIIQREGDNRIIVELPGLQDVDRAKNLIGQTALLEFKFLEPDAERDRLLNRLSAVQAGKDTTAKADTAGAQDKGLFEEAAQEAKPASGQTLASMVRRPPRGEDLAVSARDLNQVKAMLASPQVRALIPQDVEILFSSKPEPPGVPQANQYYNMYLVRRKPELTGNVLQDAQVTIGQSVEYMGQPIVNFSTTDEGTRLLSRVTGAHIGERLAIVLDGAVYSAPTIQSKIPSGEGIITGSGTQEEAKDLAIVLRAGALPANITVIEDRSVGPSLGRDSIEQGKTAALIAIILVCLFMVLYYRTGGLIADLAVVLNVFLLMSILSYFHATLTLPGIAGIILTIGMAVDANVLIFERMREELRAGKTVRASIDAGYQIALSAIVDSNVTALIAGVVLYQFGTGPIRGFALTLSIGILTSLFTAFVVTRTVYELIARHSQTPRLNIGPIHTLSNLSFPFMARRRFTYLASSILIGLGAISILAVNGLRPSIDFAGGTLLELHFDPAVRIEDLRANLGKVPVGNRVLDLSASEIKQFGSPNDIMIRVTETEAGTDVADGIKQALKAGFAGSVPDEQEWVRRQEKVGPMIGQELAGNAVNAVVVALVLILIYIAWRFHFVIWGTGAVIATFHDVVITVGLLSLLDIEISLSVVAAILTIVGYSLNDTVVVFDRIREKLRSRRREELIVTLDRSINETLSRTLITSVATLLGVTSMLIWGGQVLRDFNITLLIGIVVGTYSSIFIASPALIDRTFRTLATGICAVLVTVQSVFLLVPRWGVWGVLPILAAWAFAYYTWRAGLVDREKAAASR